MIYTIVKVIILIVLILCLIVYSIGTIIGVVKSNLTKKETSVAIIAIIFFLSMIGFLINF